MTNNLYISFVLCNFAYIKRIYMETFKEKQDGRWNRLPQNLKDKMLEEYAELVEPETDYQVERMLELEDLYGTENLKAKKMKMYTCRVTSPYAGGLAVIAARNLREAKKIVKNECYSTLYSTTNVRVIESAFIETTWPHIIEEESYAE